MLCVVSNVAGGTRMHCLNVRCRQKFLWTAGLYATFGRLVKNQ